MELLRVYTIEYQVTSYVLEGTLKYFYVAVVWLLILHNVDLAIL